MTDDVQCEKWRQDSQTLNQVAYLVAEALAPVKGLEQYLGQPVADVKRLVELVKDLRAVFDAAEKLAFAVDDPEEEVINVITEVYDFNEKYGRRLPQW